MAIPSYTISNQNDIVKQPQWVVEGNVLTNPELYGVTPASAAFQDERNGVLNWTHTPTMEETRKAGSTGREGEALVKEIHSGTLITKIVDDVTLKWAFNAEAGAGTVAESRTWVQSYYIDQTETYEIAKGCLPERATLRLVNGSSLVLEVQMMAKEVTETQTADGGLTTPTWEATPLTGLAIGAADGGAGEFDYGGVDYAEAGMVMEVTHDLSKLDPSETLLIIHARSGLRSVSGNFDIQGRPSMVMRTNQKAGTSATITRVISASPSITATITGAYLQTYSKPALDPNSGAVLVENIPFRADDIVIA